MTAYYNEIDPYAAQWLRNLIAAGHIAPGDVDERDIRDVRPDDLTGYAQCHFFAGIGGWSYALRFAGWGDDRPVWTGSCPCQPLSSTGQRKGHADKRHLWPAFYRLISECAPSVVFGEQVAGKDGREWLAGVRADLEALGYAIGAADLCAAGAGAPHIRQRLYWLAHPNCDGRQQGAEVQREGNLSDFDNSSEMGHAECAKRRQNQKIPAAGQQAANVSRNASRSFWSDSILISCADGKSRPIKPGIQPLAHGVSGRVGMLRGAGNAIVPQVAAEFIGAYLDVRAAA